MKETIDTVHNNNKGKFIEDQLPTKSPIEVKDNSNTAKSDISRPQADK